MLRLIRKTYTTMIDTQHPACHLYRASDVDGGWQLKPVATVDCAWHRSPPWPQDPKVWAGCRNWTWTVALTDDVDACWIATRCDATVVDAAPRDTDGACFLYSLRDNGRGLVHVATDTGGDSDATTWTIIQPDRSVGQALWKKNKADVFVPTGWESRRWRSLAGAVACRGEPRPLFCVAEVHHCNAGASCAPLWLIATDVPPAEMQFGIAIQDDGGRRRGEEYHPYTCALLRDGQYEC